MTQNEHRQGKRSNCVCGSGTTQQVSWRGLGYTECRDSGVTIWTESTESHTRRKHTARGIPQYRPTIPRAHGDDI